MTGFGSGKAEANGVSIYAEISTVNRKQLEIRFTLPRDFNSFEHELRKLLQAELSRGQVSVRIMRTSSAGEAAGINRSRVAALIEAAKVLGKEFNTDGNLTMAQVLTMPGVFEESSEDVSEEVKSAVISALSDAVKALNNMRAAEGAALKNELEERISLLESLREKLLPEVGMIEQNIKNKLLEKLADANLPVDVNDERFLKEVLYYTDKSDVSEELTRLASHFVQFKSFLNGAEGGGRSMDFLVQEMFREITTLGNKAGSGAVANVVVKFKTELEKIREQIQNIQ